MRATYTPDSAATVGVQRLVVAAPAGLAGDGDLTLYLTGHRRLRAPLPAEQLRDVLRRWAAAARAGQGDLEIGEQPPGRAASPQQHATHALLNQVPTGADARPPAAPLPDGGAAVRRLGLAVGSHGELGAEVLVVRL
jgi:hypothetical protein